MIGNQNVKATSERDSPLPVEASHSLSVLQSVQTEGESKPLGELFDAVEFLTVPVDPAVVLPQFFELVDEGLHHRLGAVCLVVLSCFIESVLNIFSN